MYHTGTSQHLPLGWVTTGIICTIYLVAAVRKAALRAHVRVGGGGGGWHRKPSGTRPRPESEMIRTYYTSRLTTAAAVPESYHMYHVHTTYFTM